MFRLTPFLLVAALPLLVLAQPDPTTVYAWYRADAGVLTNSAGKVTNWQNQATSGPPATRHLNLTGSEPVWVPAAMGTNPVVRFDGNANLFAAAGSFGVLNSNRTLVASLKLAGTNGGFLFDGSTSSGMTRAQIRSNSWQAGLQPQPLANGTNADPVTLAATPGEWQTHFFSFEPVAGGTRVTHSQWGGGSVTYTNAQTNGLGGLILGENVSQQLGLAMDLGEVLVFDRALDPAEVASLSVYLTNKWAAPLPPPSTSGPPAAVSVYAWYRGDDGLATLTDQYTVVNWTNHGTAATNTTLTAAKRNLNRTTGAPQKVWLQLSNGVPAAAVAFDGNNAVWAASADFGTLSGNRTVMALVRVVNATPQGFLFDSSSYTVGLTRAQVNGGNWQVAVYGPGAGGAATAPGTVTAAATTNAWQVHTFVVSTNDLRFRHFINGVEGAAVTNAVGGALGGLILGANASAGAGIRAEVAELLIFNEALAADTRTNLEAYLTAKWAGVAPDPNAPAPPVLPNFIRVFEAGTDGYTCFRIPALLTTASGTLIAMSDGRIGSCGDIPTPLDLVIKRSFDNGNTWGPLQVVTDYGTAQGDVDDYPAYGLTNVARVSAGDAALLLDRTNGRIWTLYDNGGVVSGSRKIKLEMKYSDDDGVTWSPRIDVEAANPGIRPSGGEFLAGPGNGIQLSEGPYAGRLIFPVYRYASPSASGVIYSDDHGATWQRGELITGGGEIQVAETAGGGLLASMRDNNFAWSGVRTFARSTNGGATWGPAYTNTVIPPTMADPQCQGNVFRLTTTNDSNASRLIHANAAHPSSRVNMTLRVSYDEGQTWPVSNQVYAAGSAYSSVTRCANGDVGLLFEKDPYGNLDFIRRSIAEVTGGADSLPAYDVWAGARFTPAQLMNPAVSGRLADPDGDGRTNEEEFLSGTDPLSAASVLRLEIVPVGDGAELRFQAVSNLGYTVQASATPSAGGWTRLADFPPPGSNTVLSLPVSATNGQRFFRLVTPPAL